MSEDKTNLDIDITEHRFSLFETLGIGAMGKVVLARDEDLLRHVAIKKIKHDVSQNQFLLDSFITEAQITAQLEHPCIIPVYGLEVNQEGHIAYSMKRIEGQTLSELIQSAKHQYDSNEAVDEDHNLNAFLEHFLKVADAVSYAHQKGIIHRDLKPDNIMIGTYNEVYILDWGIARPMTDPPQTLEKETQVIVAKSAEDFNAFEGSDVYGTPCYMSPEQAAGGNAFLNGQSDLYTLGLILFELISLKKAYTADEEYLRTIENSIDGKINTLTPYVASRPLPRELIAVIRKSTQRKRKDRYSQVKEMSDEIRRYLRGEAVFSEPDTSLQKVQRWMSQNREKTMALILSIALLSALMIASIIAWSIYERHQDHLTAHRREVTQAEFLNLMRDKSQEINAQLLAIAGLTQEFAAGIEQTLATQPQQKSPFYTFDMLQKGVAPPDTSFSSLYNSKVSLNHLLFKIAPGVSQKEVKDLLHQVAPYAPFMKRLFLLSHGDPYLKTDSPKAYNLLHNKGVLAVDTYAGFEDGFAFAYPIFLSNPNYDPRQRPWYKMAKNTKGVQWGQPYLDSTGLGWMIPSTKAIYDMNAHFKGVVGIDIKMSRISQMMKIPNKKFIKDVFLLNKEGQILIQGSAKAKSFKRVEIVNDLEALPLFPDAEVVKAIGSKVPSGFLHITGENGKVYSFNHLSSSEWYYLVEANEKALFEERS